MKRYDHPYKYDCPGITVHDECDEGDWVRYEDAAALQARVAELERELAAAREELKNTRESLFASNRDWQSRYDELGQHRGALRAAINAAVVELRPMIGDCFVDKALSLLRAAQKAGT